MKNRLKELRKTHGWSQADLARRLKISRQAVNGFESGKFTPSLEMALKIAGLFNVAVESIFVYQEKSPMQTLIENITQWLPKGEKFTYKAIEAIEYAQYQAALSQYSQVEPEHLLYGLLNHPTTTATRLLIEHGLTLNEDNAIARQEVPKITKFSPESKYVLELALNIARLRQKKYIDTEHLLLGLVQLMQLGDENLTDIFQRNEVDTRSLIEKITELNYK
ncbi:helix-turn-helix domain-containing protein [Pleurocapsales cyanobacterium LEGE 10410]|nr:helix-turn-helix domain-containing protein [Pleurocapsales cyanobacterium LEGE 10410]